MTYYVDATPLLIVSYLMSVIGISAILAEIIYVQSPIKNRVLRVLDAIFLGACVAIAYPVFAVGLACGWAYEWLEANNPWS